MMHNIYDNANTNDNNECGGAGDDDEFSDYNGSCLADNFSDYEKITDSSNSWKIIEVCIHCLFAFNCDIWCLK